MRPAKTIDELLDRATAIAGGTRALSRALGWATGAMSEVRAGKRPIPPYRAAQLAELAGEDAVLAIWSALRDQARSDDEREFWERQVRGRKLRVISDYVGPAFDRPPATGKSHGDPE